MNLGNFNLLVRKGGDVGLLDHIGIVNLTSLTYESGIEPMGDAWLQFRIRYYMFALAVKTANGWTSGMDADSSSDVSASTEDANAVEPKTEADSVDVLDGILSGGEVTRELETAGEVLTRVELDIARSSEKLVNLNILMMHVATKESEFEALVSEEEHDFSGSVEKALEFDFLSGILDSEVIELDNILSTLKADILNTRETISSSKHLGEAFRPFRVMEEKLNDSEESLKESLEQISEIRGKTIVWSFWKMVILHK
ncbi:hypothetical protein RJ640_028259 [Escallonia rubra]|uniref:NADH-ubiquinone oxidoreductase chain 3 n=1 Tax=Escallonia rubra TaxID=112253 RepID=A0AA88UB29_9ASTE|nr:hypothetical protein RJ640_028259 [Escallonia rubra]